MTRNYRLPVFSFDDKMEILEDVDFTKLGHARAMKIAKLFADIQAVFDKDAEFTYNDDDMQTLKEKLQDAYFSAQILLIKNPKNVKAI